MNKQTYAGLEQGWMPIKRTQLVLNLDGLDQAEQACIREACGKTLDEIAKSGGLTLPELGKILFPAGNQTALDTFIHRKRPDDVPVKSGTSIMPLKGTWLGTDFEALSNLTAMQNHGKNSDALANEGGLTTSEAAALSLVMTHNAIEQSALTTAEYVYVLAFPARRLSEIEKHHPREAVSVANVDIFRHMVIEFLESPPSAVELSNLTSSDETKAESAKLAQHLRRILSANPDIADDNKETHDIIAESRQPLPTSTESMSDFDPESSALTRSILRMRDEARKLPNDALAHMIKQTQRANRELNTPQPNLPSASRPTAGSTVKREPLRGILAP